MQKMIVKAVLMLSFHTLITVFCCINDFIIENVYLPLTGHKILVYINWQTLLSQDVDILPN